MVETSSGSHTSIRFRTALRTTNNFHDWYLKDIYVANTGKMLLTRSRPGSTTIQLEFCTSNNDVSYLLVFTEVIKVNIEMNDNEDTSEAAFTGFGRCYSYTLHTLEKEDHHIIEFEGGAAVRIHSKYAYSRKIMNNFFITP